MRTSRRRARSCDARKHDALLVPRVVPDLDVSEAKRGGVAEDVDDGVGLVVADLERDDGVVCEHAVAGEEGGDGAVEGEAVTVADECPRVLVVPDG